MKIEIAWGVTASDLQRVLLTRRETQALLDLAVAPEGYEGGLSIPTSIDAPRALWQEHSSAIGNGDADMASHCAQLVSSGARYLRFDWFDGAWLAYQQTPN